MDREIIIGSRAARYWFKDFPRECNDFDVIAKKPPEDRTRKVEYHWSPAFEWLLSHERYVASPDALYTIKVSHSFWDLHWDKTMFDIQFLKSKGCKVIEDFYKLLYEDWTKIHGPKKVNLNVSNEEFFNKYVNRAYDHDSIHKAIAYYDVPMFTKLKKDQSKAWIDRDLFEKLSYYDKIRTCREEIYVIALERDLIPSGFTVNPAIAYKRAAKSLITRMSKGWFPRFMVENWDELRKTDHHYKFKQIIEKESL